MKNFILFAFMFVFTITSCKKDKGPVNGGSTPVDFVTTKYSYLGEYDEQGRPKNLAEKDIVSSELSNFVTDKLPEKTDVRKTNPDFLKNADLTITAKSEVYITFVAEGTGFANSVGYYAYKTGQSPKKPEDIENIVYVFPHAQSNNGGTLKPGDKIKLGVFESGMSIGFVLVQKGWDFTTRKVNDKAPHFCSNKELNPENYDELKAHTVLFEYPAENKVIIGFEDINRTLPECDHDFNDVVLYATVTPVH
ncbi:DUF4114 domain-containing protein [Flavihumibacter sp. R14]|nr:DUF4114 domain-containing protein [Flavihumibacter soli]